MEAISAGVRTICAAGRPGEAAPGTAAAGADGATGKDSDDGEGSDFLDSTSGAVGASMQILHRVSEGRISGLDEYQYEPHGKALFQNAKVVSSND